MFIITNDDGKALPVCVAGLYAWILLVYFLI